jgi:hypothetical protein
VFAGKAGAYPRCSTQEVGPTLFKVDIRQLPFRRLCSSGGDWSTITKKGQLVE